MSIIANKKAFHDYFVEERFEAGIALQGWEVKAIRAGRANIKAVSYTHLDVYKRQGQARPCCPIRQPR